MARLAKPLEEQLAKAQEDLRRAEERVAFCKQQIVDIKNQIEDRDMRAAHSVLRTHNISVEELEKLLEERETKLAKQAAKKTA